MLFVVDINRERMMMEEWCDGGKTMLECRDDDKVHDEDGDSD